MVRRDPRARTGIASAFPGPLDPGPVPRGGRGRRQQSAERRNGERRVRAKRMAVHVLALDQQHPGLVHLAPALVGPPDPGVVRRGGQCLCRARRAGGAGAGACETRSRSGALRAGPRRARHLVLVGAVVPLDARMAGGHEGASHVPALVGAGDGFRHHLLLGRADDHDDGVLHRRSPVPHRLSSTPSSATRKARRCRSRRATCSIPST